MSDNIVIISTYIANEKLKQNEKKIKYNEIRPIHFIHRLNTHSQIFSVHIQIRPTLRMRAKQQKIAWERFLFSFFDLITPSSSFIYLLYIE